MKIVKLKKSNSCTTYGIEMVELKKIKQQVLK